MEQTEPAQHPAANGQDSTCLRGFTLPGRPASSDLPLHPWLERFCSHLADVVVGEAAATTLTGMGPSSSSQTFVILPLWAWSTAKTGVGRKGKHYLLPMRVVWSGSPVVPVADRPTRIAWRAAGLGHFRSGMLHLRYRQNVGRVEYEFEGDALLGSTGSLAPDPAFEFHLSALLEKGVTGWWRAVEMLKAPTLQAVREVVYALSNETLRREPFPPPLLDSLEIEEVRDALFFRPGARSGRSAVFRLLHKALEPDTFVRVDPLAFFAKNIKRDAWDEVRRNMKDSQRFGSVLRTIAHERQPASLEELLSCHRISFGEAAQPSKKDVFLSLTLGASTNSASVSYLDVLRPDLQGRENGNQFTRDTHLVADLHRLLYFSPLRSFADWDSIRQSLNASYELGRKPAVSHLSSLRNEPSLRDVCKLYGLVLDADEQADAADALELVRQRLQEEYPLEGWSPWVFLYLLLAQVLPPGED